nr:hypothetical protein Q903MT_gene2840 [Picea sitchensis]
MCRLLQVSNSSSNYICVVGVGRAVLPLIIYVSLALVEQFFLSRWSSSSSSNYICVVCFR